MSDESLNTEVTQPLPATDVYARYRLGDPREIGFHVDGLIKRGQTVSVYYGGAGQFVLSMLLDRSADGTRLVFDTGSVEGANEALLRAQRLLFVAAPDGIKVQFSTGPARRIEYGGGAAFVTAPPTELIRLQRREAFRVLMPLKGPTCTALIEGKRVSLEVYDLSVAGIGFDMDVALPVLALGHRIDLLELDLPDIDPLVLACEIRHVTRTQSNYGDKERWRIGARFEGIGPALQARIQRYLVKVERERHKLLG